MENRQDAGSGARPAALACDECRRKHLKCDGTMPLCTRCRQEQLPCNYTPSRRGYGRRKATNKHTVRTGPLHCTGYPLQPASSLGARDLDDTPASRHDSASQRALATPNSIISSLEETWIKDEDITTYYNLFHDSHPLLVPLASFALQSYPVDLRLVVCCIGRHCATKALVQSGYPAELEAAMSAELDEPKPARVQALVLAAILLHSMHRPSDAMRLLKRAVEIALCLGMNDPTFADQYSSPDVAQSIRRTWWELYITEAYFGALHQQTSKHLSNLVILPDLPSNDATIEGTSLTAFDNRCFASTPFLHKWSSDCYLVEAARLMRSVTALSHGSTPQDVQGVESGLSSWQYYVPEDNGALVRKNGTVEPIMFQAFMLVACAKIMLHFPRSDLPLTVPDISNLTCAADHAKATACGSAYHSAKAIQASNDITTLASLSSLLDKPSPLFVCALILSCVVQLAASFALRRGSDRLQLETSRDRVVLLLGVIKHMGQWWTVASHAHSVLRVLAASAFTISTPHYPAEIASDRSLDLSDLPADLPWFDLFSPDFSQEPVA